MRWKGITTMANLEETAYDEAYVIIGDFLDEPGEAFDVLYALKEAGLKVVYAD